MSWRSLDRPLRLGPLLLEEQGLQIERHAHLGECLFHERRELGAETVVGGVRHEELEAAVRVARCGKQLLGLGEVVVYCPMLASCG